MDDKALIIKCLKDKGLVKGYKKIKNLHIDIEIVKDELERMCQTYISESRYNELLSFLYMSQNIFNYDILILLKLLFVKQDYPSFLKQAYRFRVGYELRDEINKAIQWHLDNKLPDGNAWILKFNKLFDELKDKDISRGKSFYTVTFE